MTFLMFLFLERSPRDLELEIADTNRSGEQSHTKRKGIINSTEQCVSPISFPWPLATTVLIAHSQLAYSKAPATWLLSTAVAERKKIGVGWWWRELSQRMNRTQEKSQVKTVTEIWQLEARGDVGLVRLAYRALGPGFLVQDITIINDVFTDRREKASRTWWHRPLQPTAALREAESRRLQSQGLPWLTGHPRTRKSSSASTYTPAIAWTGFHFEPKWTWNLTLCPRLDLNSQQPSYLSLLNSSISNELPCLGA